MRYFMSQQNHIITLYYIPFESSYFSLYSNLIPRTFKQNVKVSNLKAIRSLLFFEQGFLDNHTIY